MTLEAQVATLRAALELTEEALDIHVRADALRGLAPDDGDALALAKAHTALAATAEPVKPGCCPCGHPRTLGYPKRRCEACGAEPSPAPDFNPLTCPVIPGDFNGPHGPLPIEPSPAPRDAEREALKSLLEQAWNAGYEWATSAVDAANGGYADAKERDLAALLPVRK